MAMQRRLWPGFYCLGVQMRKFTYLVIIPARGGSKGIKNKNIINFNGAPLITHTIKSALKAKSNNLIDEVFVSTDSKKIAKTI